jgi:DNA repair protein RecO (recombination protein O)
MENLVENLESKPGRQETGAPTASSKAGRARPARILDKEIRVAGQPAFVLHSYAYKETSLIIDVFTRD